MADSALGRLPVAESPEEKFREYLASRPRPQRFTAQQRDMIRYIFSHHNHFDAEEVIREMERKGFDVSRATVYRTLGKLVDAGLLRSHNVGARTRYEHDYGYPQHEHLVCQQCDKKIEFQSEELERIIADVCREHNFHSTSHTFIIRGTCSDCNRARVTKRRLDLV